MAQDSKACNAGVWGSIPWRREWQPTPVLLPGQSHGQRSLVGYSPWGRKESDTTERLHFHFTIVYFLHVQFDYLFFKKEGEVPLKAMLNM